MTVFSSSTNGHCHFIRVANSLGLIAKLQCRQEICINFVICNCVADTNVALTCELLLSIWLRTSLISLDSSLQGLRYVSHKLTGYCVHPSSGVNTLDDDGIVAITSSAAVKVIGEPFVLLLLYWNLGILLRGFLGGYRCDISMATTINTNLIYDVSSPSCGC